MATGRLPDPNTAPLTAKGDLYTYSTVPARLAVGSNGETLVADSSTTTGLRWQADWNTGKNKIINGDFGIWQRGTSITTGTGGTHVYTADRWLSYFYGTNTSSITQQTFTAGTAPVAGYEGQFFGRFNSTSTLNFISYRVEDVRTLANQVTTLSFWAKSNANQTLTIEVNQNFGSGGSATTNALSTTQAVTTGWTRYSFTFTPPSLSGKTIGTSSYVVISISGAINNAIDLWGAQWEAGSVATPFTTATGTLAGEFAAACRYYQVIGGTASGFPIVSGYSSGSGQYLRWPISFPVQCRTAPTITKNGTWAASNANQPAAGMSDAKGFSIQIESTSSGIIYTHPDSTDDTFTISAEL